MSCYFSDARLSTPSSFFARKQTGFIVKRVYENFVEKSVDECLTRCRDDLTALTRFVTWDLHERSAGALRRSLPDSSMVQIYSLAVSKQALFRFRFWLQ